MVGVRYDENEASSPLFLTHILVWPNYIFDKETNYIKIDTGAKGEPKEYAPSEIKCIYTHLSRLRRNDLNSILDFVNQFGLLGYETRHEYSLHSNFSNQKIFTTIQERIEYITSAASDIAEVLDLWGKVNEGIPIDRVWHPTTESNYQALTREYLEKALPAHKLTIREADSLTLSKMYIAFKASKHLGGVRPVANFTPKGEPIPGFAYLSLYDAIWHQLYMDMVTKAEFKQCPYCFSWHTGRGQFCPAPPFYKRSPCENAFNQRLHRQKKKVVALWESGKTIEEITATIGIDAEQIKAWIAQEGGKEDQ